MVFKHIKHIKHIEHIRHINHSKHITHVIYYTTHAVCTPRACLQGSINSGHQFCAQTLCKISSEKISSQEKYFYFSIFSLADRSFDEYFDDPESFGPPTVYIGFPSMKDIKWSEHNPHCKSALLIADAKWEWFAKWYDTKTGARGEEYEAFKEKLSYQLLEVLYSKVF